MGGVEEGQKFQVQAPDGMQQIVIEIVILCLSTTLNIVHCRIEGISCQSLGGTCRTLEGEISIADY
jgi:hypothetical protein